MKKSYLLFTIALSTVFTQAESTVKHTIKNGETLYTIAHKNHTTIEEVRKTNGLKKGDILKLGRVLTVPTNTYLPNKKKKNIATTTQKSKVKKTKLASYAIKSGDTLFTVARKHRTTIEEVRKANGLNQGEVLKLGRVLKVPMNTYFPDKKKKKIAKTTPKSNVKKTKQDAANYAIKSGDTLFTVARKHGMTVAELLKLNDVSYQSTLKIGQKLKVAKAISQKKKPIAKKKKVRKVKIVKNVKKKQKTRVLKTALKKHAKPIATKRIKKRRTVTVDDIFYKASQPNVMFFNSSSNKKAKNIIRLAKTKLGRKYVWGATGKRGTFDCSGFTSYVFKKNGINIPRTSINQSKFGKYVPRSKLKKGDLIFFDTSKKRKGYVNHVGIYLGNGKFIHASSAKKKVVVSRLSKFYAQRYKGARRPS